MSCAVCGSGDLRLRWRVKGDVGAEGLIPTTKEFGTALGDIVRCRSCGHMQLDRMPSEAELGEAYADAASDDYVEEEAGQRATARRILHTIERFVAPGRLVDLGCWVGFLVAEAVARGWDAVGIEPSRFASDYARERLGLDVRTEDLFAADLPPGAFRAVFLGDVIEHLPDPGRAVERVDRLLEPAGAFALTLPDSGSLVARALGRRWWSVIPTHVHYFTRDSIALLLRRHGFEVVHVGTDPRAFTIRYYLAKGGGYAPSLSRRLIRAAERTRVAERMWAPDFRDRMLVVARRRVV